MFSNCRCSVLLESLLPIMASSGYRQWVQIEAPVLDCTKEGEGVALKASAVQVWVVRGLGGTIATLV